MEKKQLEVGDLSQTEIGARCTFMFLVEQSRYSEALQIFDRFITKFNPQLLLAQAKCYLSLNQPKKALEAVLKAERNGWDLPDILLMKGRCLYKLQEFEMALQAFQDSDALKSTSPTKNWIMRCKAHITVEEKPRCANVIPFFPTKQSDVRRDWYQSNQFVTLSIYIPDIAPESIHISYQTTSLEILISQKPFSIIRIKLAKEIITDQCSHTITPSKLEIKLKKLVESKWTAFEIP